MEISDAERQKLVAAFPWGADSDTVVRPEKNFADAVARFRSLPIRKAPPEQFGWLYFSTRLDPNPDSIPITSVERIPMQLSTDCPYSPKQIRAYLVARDAGASPMRPNVSVAPKHAVAPDTLRRRGRPRKYASPEARSEALRQQKLDWWLGNRQASPQTRK